MITSYPATDQHVHGHDQEFGDEFSSEIYILDVLVLLHNCSFVEPQGFFLQFEAVLRPPPPKFNT